MAVVGQSFERCRQRRLSQPVALGQRTACGHEHGRGARITLHSRGGELRDAGEAGIDRESVTGKRDRRRQRP
jgi:hypothetical protein